MKIMQVMRTCTEFYQRDAFSYQSISMKNKPGPNLNMYENTIISATIFLITVHERSSFSSFGTNMVYWHYTSQSYVCVLVFSLWKLMVYSITFLQPTYKRILMGQAWCRVVIILINNTFVTQTHVKSCVLVPYVSL